MHRVQRERLVPGQARDVTNDAEAQRDPSRLRCRPGAADRDRFRREVAHVRGTLPGPRPDVEERDSSGPQPAAWNGPEVPTVYSIP
jgi:hypothetical protein